MSDFDKEAERERLREKYERDQEKRESTERMSELLLKGATMTNAHCDECGDPVFRYDGQEFCPTCEEVVSADAESGAAENGAADGASGDGHTADETEPTAAEADSSEAGAAGTDTAEAGTAGTGTSETGAAESDSSEAGAVESDTAVTGATGTDTAETVGADGTATAPQSARTSTDAATAGTGQSRESTPRSGSSPARGPTPEQEPTPEATGASGGDGLAAARESLVRTLVAQSQRAEACDDPRRARDHLAAAREAAEALSALSY